jgi:hypothetical protein
MPELKGQMEIFDVLADELAGEPSAARAVSILETAKDLGWTENPSCSFVIRLTRDDAKPFYARWDLGVSETGKKSWRFQGARAINGQPLAFGDIKTYLEDPSVIYPEPPDELAEAAEHEDPDQTEAGALEALKPLTTPSIPSPDWGAIFSG